jgi:5-formyltetrahydrofolate cyclo-ligase
VAGVSVDPVTVREAKSLLRERMRTFLGSVTPAQWEEASSRICEHIIHLPAYRRAGTVMLYYPTPREIDLRSLAETCMRTGRTVCLPRADWTTGELQPARIARWGEGLTGPIRGVPQPLPDAPAVPPLELDLVIVPGLSFDRTGGRLGRGAGFYDRFLKAVRAFKVGVCLSEQMVECVPATDADVHLDAIVTPDGVVGGARKDEPAE